MNANQKRWLQWVGSQPCMVTGEYQIQVHHIWGRTTRSNKINIGHWAIIPLAIRFHDVNSNSPFNITHHRKRFEIEFGATEKQLWQKLFIKSLSDERLKVNDRPPISVTTEIMNYRR